VTEFILSGYEPAEYRTKWFAHDYPGLGYRELENILNEIPTASVIEGKGYIVGLHDSGNKLIVRISAESDVRIRFRRFYYPGWYLENLDAIGDESAIELSPYYALIETSLPAGNHSVTLARRTLPEEDLGTALSIISLLYCIYLILSGIRRSTRFEKYST
jgi:hypothetical protein